MKTDSMRVIVIDSDEKFHKLYGDYLKNQDEFMFVAAYGGINEALEEFKATKPDIIVSEVELKGPSGILGIEYFRRKSGKNAKIVLVSAQNDFNLIKSAFKNGASGYLTKPLDQERFLNALKSIKNDGAALSHDVAKKVINMFRPQSYGWMSKRENQIVQHLCQGLTYKMIAEKLFVTPSTVNFHIQNIYLKLNVNSKSEALEKLDQLQAFGKAS